MPVINDLLKMRQYFETGATKSFAFRKEQLTRLKQTILKYEQSIQEALYKDLKKSPEETWVTETGFLLSEISYAINHLNKWMKRESVGTNLLNIPSKSFIVKEPLGTVLIIGPWNYPLQLLFTPLTGAIAAGNCVVLKASEFAPATAALMKQIIAETFDPQYVLFTEGDGATVIPEMMNNFVFDHVFYTGSTAVGKIIYQMAAKNLVPVTLELGGKSPCVVEADADITVTAKRIAMAKFSNAGQMCVTPDYVLVHASKKEALIAALKKALTQFMGQDAKDSYDYGRIINEKQFDRIVTYLAQGNLLAGGKTDRSALYIEPSLIDQVSMDMPIMKEEIFGPVLPVISFTTMQEARDIIAKNPNPLAFYIFTCSSEKEKEWINAIPFGGGCINNAALHLTNHQLPFGGRGTSGTGNYHGKFSFDTFSHRKGILKTPTWFDPKMKYPSYKGKLNIFKWLMK
ncbi:aldehyde dehydrogenase [Ferruginibacter sp.]|uniref:aldehyde dehydrogenase n=1 Tax=Ferruginibacter sp. TaxID=1940288 RepID=UPI0026594D5D|nr:aldehyde dehydrogenase [Ferruginibacter sp.]